VKRYPLGGTVSQTQPDSIAASCFEPSRQVDGIPEVTDIYYDLQALRITLTFADREEPVHATFHESRGFRVLDEGDLTEFWNPETRPDGWLWRISAGGWLDLERTRPAFITGLGDQYMEFLVVGVDDCVSIIASAEPVLDLS
jgi:hypothetical protein